MSLKSIKFGGTSMGSAKSILECADITKKASKSNSVIVTVSAIGGVTSKLLNIIQLAKNQKPRLVNKKVSELQVLHREILENILSDNKSSERVCEKNILPLFKSLRSILYGTSLVGDLTSKTIAHICSFGEKLSSHLAMQALHKVGVTSQRVESEKIIRTDSCYLEANIHTKMTYLACRKTLTPLLKKNIVPIVTGFIGKDTHGDITLLGRGGSDYTAAILAVALFAKVIEIWTDVDGIMSSDPKIVPNSLTWSILDIQLMSEMAYSGAKVLHPKSITTAVERGIPVYVLNVFNRKAKGTKVVVDKTEGVKGITISKNNVLLHLENPNMLEEVGFISKITDIVEHHNAPIDVCATSETSFTFSIAEDDYSKKLHKELLNFSKLNVINNITKICIIGFKVTKKMDLLADVFHICLENQILARSVSMGASSRNITLMVDKIHGEKFLNLLHSKLIN